MMANSNFILFQDNHLTRSKRTWWVIILALRNGLVTSHYRALVEFALSVDWVYYSDAKG